MTVKRNANIDIDEVMVDRCKYIHDKVRAKFGTGGECALQEAEGLLITISSLHAAVKGAVKDAKLEATMNDDSDLTELPAIGDEVVVNIRPSIRSDEKWMVRGNVLTVRQEPNTLIVATIKIAGPMTADGLQSDDRWSGCVVDAVYNQYSAEWRATRPASDRAKEVWGNVWSQQD